MVQQQQQPPMPQPPPPNVPPPTPYGPDEVTLVYERIVRDLEQHLQVIPILPNSPMTVQLHGLLDTAIQTRNSRDSRAANILLQKVGRGRWGSASSQAGVLGVWVGGAGGQRLHRRGS